MKRYFPRRVPVLLLLVAAGLAGGCNLWAYWHYQAAQRALARWAFAEAQPHLAKALKIWFWSASTQLLAGRTARRAGDFDAAEHYLLVSRELDGPAEAISLEYMLLRAQRGELARVEGYLLAHLQQESPDVVLVAEVLTPAYFQTYQLTGARHCADIWVEHEPDRLEAWRWRTQICDRTRSRPERLENYRRLIELAPEDDSGHLLLGALLTDGHRPEEALEHFEHVRQRRGDTPEVLSGIARCKRALNQPEEARRLLEAVLARQPRNGLVLAERGRLALETEAPAEAVKWFRRAAASMPYEKDILYGLYQCLERLGNHEEAKQVQARLGRVEADLSRLATLTQTIGQEPHDPGLRLEAGKILIRNGEEAEGLRWLESALREDPNHAATHAALADYYESKGDVRRAAEHRQLALPVSTELPPHP